MACCASSAFGSSAAARGRRKAARYRTSSRRRSTSSSNLSPRGGIPIEVPGSAHGCRAQARRLDVQKARAHPAARPPPSAPFRRALRVGSMLPNPVTHTRAGVDASPRARQTKISMSLVPGPESLRDAGRSGGAEDNGGRLGQTSTTLQRGGALREWIRPTGPSHRSDRPEKRPRTPPPRRGPGSVGPAPRQGACRTSPRAAAGPHSPASRTPSVSDARLERIVRRALHAAQQPKTSMSLAMRRTGGSSSEPASSSISSASGCMPRRRRRPRPRRPR